MKRQQFKIYFVSIPRNVWFFLFCQGCNNLAIFMKEEGFKGKLGKI